eukprot:Gregarina_sp_Poly_1__8331@NODE_487_length_7975_cov_341_032752_g393_i0_p4_GENE_NODE_487_length_7975_cov_341_032752_g393_i0NODE_487_length_7975_cov_341_032752_g393_i0_p4_ORF_typecomplete_len226_score25_21Cnl2_NKP2/PF09447_10/0_023GST_C_3/PF14497_6/0_031CRIC_ras_sig/PF10534_9/0_31CRIC_ras_sig/PF10534_9/3_3e03_NODE_487_length_7975_cov_341_032752_g393_i016252302
MTLTKKPVMYSRTFDPTLEPARLAFAIGGVTFEDSELDQLDLANCVEARSPSAKLPFAAADDILIAGPVSILYHAASLANLMPTVNDCRHLLIATMIVELVNNTLTLVSRLKRRPFSVAGKMDEEKDRLLTVDVPKALQLLEQSLQSSLGEKSMEEELDVANVAVAALHNYLTELTDIYSTEDFASLFPQAHKVALEVSQLKCVADWRAGRYSKLLQSRDHRWCF